MSTDDNSARAVAERAAEAWADACRIQRWATPDHADFYGLACELVTTLHAMEDLTGVLVEQVAGYATGRTLYDDTRAVDPGVRLADAVDQLRAARTSLSTAEARLNEFWNTIGHVGVEVTP